MPDNSLEYEACDNCGSTELSQTATVEETVHIDEEYGGPDYFEEQHIEVQELRCDNCDTVLWEDDE